MNPWIFYDFVDGGEGNIIRAWLDSLPAKASAKIDARILFMRTIRIWPEAYVSSLKGWPGLIELRVGTFGNQYRPLGFYGPNRGEFTLVLGAVEKGKLPKSVLEAADGNREIAKSDRSRIVPHAFNQSAANPKPQYQ